MIRMEVACFVIMAYISVIYFSAKREKSIFHKTFRALLIVMMIHLILDGATVYSVNHLDSIPRVYNDVLHRAFSATMLLAESLYTCYIMFLIEEGVGKKEKIHIVFQSIVLLFLISSFVLPISYTLNPVSNYESGVLAFEIYIGTTFCTVSSFLMLMIYWKKIQSKKRFVIITALLIEGVTLCIQSRFPTMFISGMGLTLITLSIYITLENPDIELLNRANIEKRRAEEANASKSAMVSVVSHEIRTPMNAVVGMTDLLLTEDLTEKQRKYMENIKRSAASLVLIVNDVLDQSKMEAGKMELISEVYEVKPILDDVRLIIENCIGEKEISVIYEIEDDVPKFLKGDAVKLRQVLINLMNNAVKFTSQGFIRLKISVEQREKNNIKLRFAVKDSGQGIMPEDQQKLFQAFTRVDIKKNYGKEGTGLGLSISKDLIELMGGQLSVCSEYGKGSTFYFVIDQEIPSEEKCRMLEQQETHKEFTAEGARILVVDDTEINRTIIRESLKSQKIRVDMIDSSIKALKMIEKVKYDVVFMDYLLPGVDGIECTRRIRALEGGNYKELPVIAMTGDVSTETKEKFLEAGANDFLEKPVNIQKMKVQLLKYLPESFVVWQEKTME